MIVSKALAGVGVKALTDAGFLKRVSCDSLMTALVGVEELTALLSEQAQDAFEEDKKVRGEM